MATKVLFAFDNADGIGARNGFVLSMVDGSITQVFEAVVTGRIPNLRIDWDDVTKIWLSNGNAALHEKAFRQQSQRYAVGKDIDSAKRIVKAHIIEDREERASETAAKGTTTMTKPGTTAAIPDSVAAKLANDKSFLRSLLAKLTQADKEGGNVGLDVVFDTSKAKLKLEDTKENVAVYHLIMPVRQGTTIKELRVMRNLICSAEPDLAVDAGGYHFIIGDGDDDGAIVVKGGVATIWVRFFPDWEEWASAAKPRNKEMAAPAKQYIWGGVVVKGKEYMDDEIAQLVGKNIAGWKYAGDIGDEGDILIVANGARKVFKGKKALEGALAYIKKIGLNLSKEKTAVAKKPTTKPNSRDAEIIDGYTEEEALKLVTALNKKVKDTLKLGDFTQWMAGEGKGSVEKFDAAVVALIGKDARDAGENVARLENLVRFALGMGEDNVGGISMKKILQANPKGSSAKSKDPEANKKTPGPAAKPTPGAKSLAKTKAQLKTVNTSLAKLKGMKAVQNYIKLAKMQARLKSKMS